jgi:hypothetical protein
MSGGRSQCKGCDRAEHVVSPSCPPLRQLDRHRQPATPNAQIAFGVRHRLLSSPVPEQMPRSAPLTGARAAARSLPATSSKTKWILRQAILALGLGARKSAPGRQKKWGPALLPAPTAPSEGSAGVRNLVRFCPKAWAYPLSILAHQLRRRFPSDRSLRRGALTFYRTALPEGSLVFRCPACPLRTQFSNRSP